MMHLHRNDLLTIESTSASKPSLMSSFWSINVQVQNNERLELDPKTCSQFSLPEVTQNEGEVTNASRPARSLSVTDLCTKYESQSPSALPVNFASENSKSQPPPSAKEAASCRVADWLTNLDINK
ncbi:unnamed protein product [Caenorhabditis sp. 36 PRJEB53466]|nr:unnamed protein product [Caenorhabditis sp. 36 PRJEB53466]